MSDTKTAIGMSLFLMRIAVVTVALLAAGMDVAVRAQENAAKKEAAAKEQQEEPTIVIGVLVDGTGSPIKDQAIEMLMVGSKDEIVRFPLFPPEVQVSGNTRARKAPAKAKAPKTTATKPVGPGAAILQAKKDPANLVVVLDVSGKYTIFPASVIGDVNENNVTLKANVRDALVADVAQTEYGPEKKVAEWLFKQWLTWRREAPAGTAICRLLRAGCWRESSAD